MKILIADQHPEVQNALKLIAGRIAEVTEVSETGSLVQLLAECAQTCPDLILFDLDLVHPTRAHPPPLPGMISVLKRLCPQARVVALSTRFDAQAEALTAGACGFISKTDPPDEVLASIRRFLNADKKDRNADYADFTNHTDKKDQKTDH